MKVKTARKTLKEKKPPNKKTFATQLLRRGSFRWPPRSEAIRLARKERGLYECAMCKNLFKNKEFILDHIVPIVDPKTGWTSFDDFIDRLFCDVSNFQVLCINCSDSKTAVEDELRKYYSDIKKQSIDKVTKK